MAFQYSKTESYGPTKKKYGFWRFIGDVLLGCLTGGIWWLYLLFRALRK